MGAGRKKLVVGNWKMNLTPGAATALAGRVAAEAGSLSSAEAWVAAPFPYLMAVRDAVSASPVRLGAQNVHWAQSGAFTGEVSPSMLAECGCSFALTGHSERRTHGGESDRTVAARTAGAASRGLTTLLCVGENREERGAGGTGEVLARQLGAAFSPDVWAEYARGPAQSACESGRIVVAYEPVWCIGSGEIPCDEDVTAAVGEIRRELERLNLPASAVPVLYGGSVTPDNAAPLVTLPGVDGLLVGGASLDADSFSRILRSVDGAG